MQIKTLLGNSIQDALAEARALLGDDVVLLESHPARDGQPARITVMLDEAAPAAPAPAPAPAPLGFGYGAARTANFAATAAASVAAAPASVPAPAVAPAFYEPAVAVAEPVAAHRPAAPFLSPVLFNEAAPLAAAPDSQLERLFAPPAPAARAFQTAAPAPAPVAAPTAYAAPAPLGSDAGDLMLQLETRLAARFEAMAGRLALMERTLTAAASGSAGAWAVHPTHSAVLKSGLSGATTAALFREAAERGLTPEADGEPLRWTLAGALRDRLAPTAPSRHAAQVLAVVGSAGAGKTSLLLKLAADPRYFGHRTPAVLVVAPEDGAPAMDPTPFYHQHGLPVRTVSTPEEVRAALTMTSEFDGLLIDTPALPADPAAARAALERLRVLLAPVAPLEVVLVLDAARAAAPLTGRDLETLPLVPTAAAVTHLDEVEGWGRAAEWLLDLGLPVPFAVTGPARTGALAPYSPGWLAENLARQWADAPAA